MSAATSRQRMEKLLSAASHARRQLHGLLSIAQLPHDWESWTREDAAAALHGRPNLHGVWLAWKQLQEGMQ